jgi:signal transduction histidine kinase
MPIKQPLVDDIQSFAQNIVDTVREPLLILDTTLRVRSANRAFYQTFRVSPDQTEGCLVYELGNHQWDIPALRALLEDVIPKRSVFDDFELEHTFPGIGRRVMLLNARKLRPGDHPELIVLALEDVTERRRAHDLEVRFTEALQESYRRLQVLERLRDDLMHMIVHDLRTPLTSLMSGIQTVPLAGDLNEAQQEMIGIAVDGGQTLLGMINDLLDVDKMESGSIQLDYAELTAAELIADAVGQVASLAASHGLTLVQAGTEELPPFQGDQEKLRRVLVNLLGNAIKFTPAGGTVTAAARLVDEGRAVQFSVSDTGEGIPPEAFTRVFEKFGQVDSRVGGRKMSTGLGLAFCKVAVEAHGGAIKVESGPAEGSTFSFTIPRRPAPSRRASPGAPPAPGG